MILLNICLLQVFKATHVGYVDVFHRLTIAFLLSFPRSFRRTFEPELVQVRYATWLRNPASALSILPSPIGEPYNQVVSPLFPGTATPLKPLRSKTLQSSALQAESIQN